MRRDPAWHDEVARLVRIGQIIVAGMAAGPTLFLAIVLLLGSLANRVGDDGQPLLTWLALGFAAVMVVLRFVVPGIVVSRRRAAIARGVFQPGQGAQSPSPQFHQFLDRTGDAGLLWLVFLTKTILAGATLEGAALFLLVAYLIEGDLLSLVVAIVLIFGIVAMMPSRPGVLQWIEDQLRHVEQERQLIR
ncbi:MAG: hypothetical protein NUV77_13795 [Thermoguttaceae bacterium]|jgi:hypothetical protein|nr:hypothetical protein [Thermoguttaceae bacterium]